jgi:hypothetical protein
MLWTTPKRLSRWAQKFGGGSATNHRLRKGDRNSTSLSEPPHGGENKNHSIFNLIETI